MLWLVCHNPEIDWRTGEVKIMRCLEECGKQEKSEWQKQKKEEKEEERNNKRGNRRKKKIRRKRQ